MDAISVSFTAKNIFRYNCLKNLKRASAIVTNFGSALLDHPSERITWVFLLVIPWYATIDPVPFLDYQVQYGRTRSSEKKQAAGIRYKENLKPEKNYEYFLIGNFNSDKETDIIEPPNTLGYAYYLIDDVALMPIPCPNKQLPDEINLTLDDLMFEFDSWQLTVQGKEEISSWLGEIALLKIKQVNIVGHTDTIGSSSYNMKLSRKRARAVYHEFLEVGVDNTIISYIGAGSTKLIGPGNSARNRRVVITLVLYN